MTAPPIQAEEVGLSWPLPCGLPGLFFFFEYRERRKNICVGRVPKQIIRRADER